MLAHASASLPSPITGGVREQVGKFYELFEEDALTGHRELDLAFMGKGAPHVGFPEAVLGKYAEKLVSLGYKVGGVEQMER